MKRFKILLLGMLTLSMLSSCFPSPEEPSAPVMPPSTQTEIRELPDEKPQLPEPDEDPPPDEDLPPEETPQTVTYVLNTNTMKFHKPSCRSVKQIKPKNRLDTVAAREDVVAQGYSSCGICHP